MAEPRAGEAFERVVSEDGTPIAVWRSGEGPPLVLVHGAAADHNRWAPVLPALNERFTVLAIDRRGREPSGDAGDYAIEKEYADLAAVAALPDCRVVVMPSQRHAAMDTATELFTSEVRGFLGAS